MQKNVFELNTMSVFMGVAIVLAVSDPEFPGALPAFPQIPLGFYYAQGIGVGLIVYYLSHWILRAVIRGRFEFTRSKFEVFSFTIAIMMLTDVFPDVGQGFCSRLV